MFLFRYRQKYTLLPKQKAEFYGKNMIVLGQFLLELGI
jgi:hypothetical protein